jgi:hypothetical protein
LKELSVFLLILLMFVPPVQVHLDAVIFTDTVENHHVDVLGDSHEDDHHKSDTEDNKNSKHHHHCTSLGFSSAIISPFSACCNLKGVTQVKKPNHYYQKSLVSNYLETLLEPPQV